MANRENDRTQTQQGGARQDRSRDNQREDKPREDNPRGGGDDEVRGIADEEGDEFEETDTLDEDEDDEAGM
jgi:hypothetical protein